MQNIKEVKRNHRQKIWIDILPKMLNEWQTPEKMSNIISKEMQIKTTVRFTTLPLEWQKQKES